MPGLLSPVYNGTANVNLVPGQPGKSITWVRMTRPPDDDAGKHGRMPLIASYVVDQMAVDLIGNWITSITACP